MTPRMELYAALLATRLDQMIRREIDMPVDSFTSGLAALAFFDTQRTRTRFQIFVANQTSPQEPNGDVFKHRLTLLTKHPEGLVDTLLKNDRWSQGAPFLQQLKETWPQRPCDIGKISDSDPEVNKTVEVFANKVNNQSDLIDKAKEKISS